jgi:hypothetical protein
VTGWASPAGVPLRDFPGACAVADALRRWQAICSRMGSGPLSMFASGR